MPNVTGFDYARIDDAPEETAEPGTVSGRLITQYGNVSAWLYTFPPGSDAGTDFHGDNIECAVVLDGELEDEGGTHSAGSVWLARPGSVHHPRSKKGARVVVWLINQSL